MPRNLKKVAAMQNKHNPHETHERNNLVANKEVFVHKDGKRHARHKAYRAVNAQMKKETSIKTN